MVSAIGKTIEAAIQKIVGSHAASIQIVAGHVWYGFEESLMVLSNNYYTTLDEALKVVVLLKLTHNRIRLPFFCPAHYAVQSSLVLVGEGHATNHPLFMVVACILQYAAL